MIFKYFHSIRYLKIEQVLYRVFYKFKTTKVVNIRGVINKKSWRWSGLAINEQSIFSSDNVRFLSIDGSISNAEAWNDKEKDKLWLYNLHYFDDLNSVNFKDRHIIHLEIISRWIDENPPCEGNGWEPYPISLRMVNWIKWLSKQEKVEPKFLNSLMLQADALSKQLEYHILGNHLFANSKALIFCGCFLDCSESTKFLNLGIKILDREISEQFLDDGAHFELSPMYHEILLLDLLELIDLAEITQNSNLMIRLPYLKDVAKKALNWLKSMLHPDHELSFFNDSAFGITASSKNIFQYANKLGIQPDLNTLPLQVNKASGYSKIQFNDNVLIFDHAHIGPDYLPGHAHADTLSFELSVNKQRLFVNSGTSLYGRCSERLRQRGTSAHNTVVVDGKNSSEVWSGFRVARRAKARLLKSYYTAEKCVVEASHDGYHRLKGRVTHTRRIEAKDSNIIISDKLTGLWHFAEVHYHLHPDVKINFVSNKLVLTLPLGETFILHCDDDLVINDSTWHPRFGVSIPNQKLVYSMSKSKHNLTIERID